MFKLLDEECLVPKGTDQTFIRKLQSCLASKKEFVSSDAKHFTIQHYAGNVTYECTDFLEKNRDTMFDDLKELCFSSASSLLVNVFQLVGNACFCHLVLT